MAKPVSHRDYWRANLILLSVLLSLWFLFGCVLPIFLVEELNRFRIGGLPLGFWIAQQGSIVVFVILILVYAALMSRLDRKYDVEEPQK